jgi:PrcB C-terminal
VLESRGELETLLPGAPEIDFARRRAVLVATGPRSSSGYALDVTSVREERRRVVVQVRERSPSLRDAVRPRVTYPFRLITVPRGDKPIEVER